jgi:hypothetical protein
LLLALLPSLSIFFGISMADPHLSLGSDASSSLLGAVPISALRQTNLTELQQRLLGALQTILPRAGRAHFSALLSLRLSLSFLYLSIALSRLSLFLSLLSLSLTSRSHICFLLLPVDSHAALRADVNVFPEASIVECTTGRAEGLVVQAIVHQVRKNNQFCRSF